MNNSNTQNKNYLPTSPQNVCENTHMVYPTMESSAIHPFSAPHRNVAPVPPLTAAARAVLAMPLPCSWPARSARGPACRAPAGRALSPRIRRRGAGLPLRPRLPPTTACTHKGKSKYERWTASSRHRAAGYGHSNIRDPEVRRPRFGTCPHARIATATRIP